MDQSELQALGLYEPAEDNAELKLQLLDYLIELGATADELLAYRDMLPGLAGVLGIRGGPGRTLMEVARSSGLNLDQLRRIVRAAGLPDPDPDAPVFTDGFVALASAASGAIDLFGEDPFYQLVRVMGAAMAKVADAAISAFLVQVEPAARGEDPVGLAVAKANVEATALLPLAPTGMDVLFRQHLLLAQRTTLPDADTVRYETQPLVVGFVDLVGSAELAEYLSLSDLGAVLSEFEEIALDAVTKRGGRLVKLIGDEVLFTASDARSASQIALDLAKACKDHDLLPEVRAGLASGMVMLRDGDVFGPVVNLAARVLGAAEPGQVVATLQVIEAGGLPAVPLGPRQLKGIAGTWRLYAVEG